MFNRYTYISDRVSFMAVDLLTVGFGAKRELNDVINHGK